jgi:hypothetical protein
MMWTHEKPKESGWYWYRESADSVPEIVQYCAPSDIWRCGYDGLSDVDTLTGEWQPVKDPD